MSVYDSKSEYIHEKLIEKLIESQTRLVNLFHIKSGTHAELAHRYHCRFDKYSYYCSRQFLFHFLFFVTILKILFQI